MESVLARLPEIVIQVVAFAFALSVHEASHGWVAERLGDPTARWLGRITLNPLKHIDPFGTVLFPIMLAVLGAPVIGWAKPVPFVSRNLRNPRRDPALVALAGPASNLVVSFAATAFLLVLKAVMPSFQPMLAASLRGAMGASGILPPLLYLVFAVAMVNLVLAVFNLIPIPPLDGSHVLIALLPGRAAYAVARLAPYGMFLLFALLWTGVFGSILTPFIHALVWLVLS